MEGGAAGVRFGGLGAFGVELDVAGEDGGGHLIAIAGEKHFRMIGFGMGMGGSIKCALHVAIGENALNGVVVAEEERGFVGLEILTGARHVGAGEKDGVGALVDDAALGVDVIRMRLVDADFDR